MSLIKPRINLFSYTKKVIDFNLLYLGIQDRIEEMVVIDERFIYARNTRKEISFYDLEQIRALVNAEQEKHSKLLEFTIATSLNSMKFDFLS